jgi:hypothetical protein
MCRCKQKQQVTVSHVDTNFFAALSMGRLTTTSSSYMAIMLFGSF